jgi:hypothetical protein
MLHEEFIKDFLVSFPQFASIAEQEFYWWHGRQPPLHIFFSSVMDPFLVKEINSPTDPILVARIFEYLEKIAGSEVKGVDEALISTLSWLGNDEGTLNKARMYMGPKILKLSQDVESYWSRDIKV